MTEIDFIYDVFLSHSREDESVVREIAERLRSDGLTVWFAPWESGQGEDPTPNIEHGLEHARVLILFLSRHALSSGWPTLEEQTFRFRNPHSPDRRFVTVRLDETYVEKFVGQSIYIDRSLPWDEHYIKLLKVCWTKSQKEHQGEAENIKLYDEKHHLGRLSGYAFSTDGKHVLTAAPSLVRSIRLWEVPTGAFIRSFDGHTAAPSAIAWSNSGRLVGTGSSDCTVRLWEPGTGVCLHTFVGHNARVTAVAVSSCEQFILSGSADGNIRLWDIASGVCRTLFNGHQHQVAKIVWIADQPRFASASYDGTVRIWDTVTGAVDMLLQREKSPISDIAITKDGMRLLSGRHDTTLDLWDLASGKCLRIFEGHLRRVGCVALSVDERYILSGSLDRSVMMWEGDTGKRLRVLEGFRGEIRGLSWSARYGKIVAGDTHGLIKATAIPERGPLPLTDFDADQQQIQYTNAKVVVVGESGAGKTGLASRLAFDQWKVSDSTVGAWATQWKLPVGPEEGTRREIWLWDFGGQADQRLIHQLYLDDAALAIFVFDGQRENILEALAHWDRDITNASRNGISKILVAGRIDAGGVRLSRTQIERFRKEHGYARYLETSAKTGFGCELLRKTVVQEIRWDSIPWRSSPLLFKQLREEIIRMKDEGTVLMRFNDLREALRLRVPAASAGFSDDQLRAVLSLLSSPGVLWELKFGSWILLQPEIINGYAQAVIQTMRADLHERGCLPEELVLRGDLVYNSMRRLGADDERIVLLAMHQTLVERGFCLREHTDQGTLLVFPSYYKRERGNLGGHPAVLVTYCFKGFIDDIYATLVVRLHHTSPFQQDELWHNAADFRTLTGKLLGFKLTRSPDGLGKLDVYFENVQTEEIIIFSKYIHEHLLRHATDVVRFRHYVCLHCGTAVGNREVVVRMLEQGKKDLPCIYCEQRIPLWDPIEDLFASHEMKERVRILNKESDIVLGSESKERALVGEVISTIALADQICREHTVSDHGIDMEVEFRDDRGEASGIKIYLQLKSGASYLRKRKKDGAEIFTVGDERHARYWMSQPFPVILIIRSAKGESRWMEVRDLLRRESLANGKAVKSFHFSGKKFDVMSVRQWRDNALRGSQSSS